MRSIAALVLTVLFAAPAAAVQVTTMPRPANSPMFVPQLRATTPERATEIRDSLGNHSLARLHDPNTPEGRLQIAQIEAALNVRVADEIKNNVVMILGQSIYADDSAESLRALAAAIEQYIETYHVVLSGTDVLNLQKMAREVRSASETRTMDAARKTADALGTGRQTETVAGSQAPRRSTLAVRGDVPPNANPSEKPSVEQKKGSALDDGLEPKKPLHPINLLLNSGIVLIMGAFGWWTTVNWMVLGPFGIMAVAGVFAGVMFMAGRLAYKNRLPYVAGLLNAGVVGMVPLFAYGALSLFNLQPGSYRGYWTNIDPGWVMIELATVAAAAAMAMFARAKAAMVALPAAIALWFLSMDFARLVTGSGLGMSQTHSWFSVMAGVGFLALGRYLDKITKVNYAFWVNLAGWLAFTGGMATLPSNGEFGRFMFAAVHFGMAFLGTMFNRATYVVFGGGVAFLYAGYLFGKFAYSFDFVFAAVMTGGAIIALAVALIKYWPGIAAWWKAKFPKRDVEL